MDVQGNTWIFPLKSEKQGRQGSSRKGNSWRTTEITKREAAASAMWCTQRQISNSVNSEGLVAGWHWKIFHSCDCLLPDWACLPVCSEKGDPVIKEKGISEKVKCNTAWKKKKPPHPPGFVIERLIISYCVRGRDAIWELWIQWESAAASHNLELLMHNVRKIRQR